MTEATRQALTGLRDLSTIEWYVIPLLALVFYVYNKEIRLARKTGDWNPIFAGLAVFGMDFFNETWNGWVMVLTGRSAFWTTPGETALRTLVGWNIEIMFMFAILGIIYAYALSEKMDETIFGVPEKWFWAVIYTTFCVFVECLLNAGGHLVWEYPFWNRTLGGVWLIWLFGYFHFFCAAIFIISRKTIKGKLATIGVIYAAPIIMNVIGFGVMGWRY